MKIVGLHWPTAMGKAQAKQGSFVRCEQKTPAPKTRQTHFRVKSSFSCTSSILEGLKINQTSNVHVWSISLGTCTCKVHLIKRTVKVCVCVYASRLKGVVRSQSSVTFLWSPTILTSDPLTSTRYFPSHNCSSLDIFSLLFTVLCKSSRWLYVKNKKQINSFLIGLSIGHHASIKVAWIPFVPHSDADFELQQVVIGTFTRLFERFAATWLAD